MWREAQTRLCAPSICRRGARRAPFFVCHSDEGVQRRSLVAAHSFRSEQAPRLARDRLSPLARRNDKGSTSASFVWQAYNINL